MPEQPSTDSEPQRTHQRMEVGVAARLQTIDGRKSASLVDLSQSGAHLVLDEPVFGKQAVLFWLDFEVFGDIAWQRGNEVGIQFDGVLPLRILVETRRRAPLVVQEESLAVRQWVEGER